MKMRSFKGIICAAAIAALGVIGTGCEDDDEVVDGSVFDTIDVNADNLVSTTEWAASFGTWDVNDDGYVSESEYLLDDGFDDLDVDDDGLLTETEWNSAMVDWDLDGDGFLDEDEMFV
jgi:hypothetical protein